MKNNTAFIEENYISKESDFEPYFVKRASSLTAVGLESDLSFVNNSRKNSEQLTLNIKSNHSRNNSEDQFTIEKYESKRICCGYFKTRFGCCITWSTIIILFLGALGIMGWYYYPKIPAFVISKPYIPGNSSGLTISPIGNFATLIQNANETNPFIMSMQYAVNVTLISEMRMDVDISVISLMVITILFVRDIFSPIKLTGPFQTFMEKEIQQM